MSKRVYVVSVTRRAYVLAEDHLEALDYADAIDENEDAEVDYDEADTNVLKWFATANVYHANQDEKKITVKEAFDL